MKQKKIIVIGAGISGLSIAKLLNDKYEVVIFEKDSQPGGLIKCDITNGHLFHKTGGHVFNTKRKDVLEWFWHQFNREKEFIKKDRNSVVSMSDGRIISYPIENHVYQFTEDLTKRVIQDLISMANNKRKDPNNFEDFLRFRFGETLYKEYFQPYNEKIWRRPLKSVPISWLEGKLPMPTLEEIIYNNIIHLEEKQFVHSTFYYPRCGGSQFIANRLSEGIKIRYNTIVHSLEKKAEGWFVNGEQCDKVIFCGNIKDLPRLTRGKELSAYTKSIESLHAHGTTTVLCEIDENPYTWVYMPSRLYEAHRIICTGNLSPSNKGNNIMSATIEFTDYFSEDEILDNLKRIPLNPKYVTHNYCEFTYPIQGGDTRQLILALKKLYEPNGLFLLGRFAEWEYYNMDAAIGAALELSKKL